eukprot:45972-Rhodomonas_salina.1
MPERGHIRPCARGHVTGLRGRAWVMELLCPQPQCLRARVCVCCCCCSTADMPCDHDGDRLVW